MSYAPKCAANARRPAAVFLFIVTFLGWAMRAKEEQKAVAAPPPLTKDQHLLAEIRAALVQRASTS
jgi:hypothetical protein